MSADPSLGRKGRVSASVWKKKAALKGGRYRREMRFSHKKPPRPENELNQKKRTIDKTPPDVGKWKYYIRGYFNGEEI